MLKKILIEKQAGLRTGSLVYLLTLLLPIQKSSPTAGNIISILIMSGLIGILSLLFDLTDRIPFLWILLLHFIGTVSLAAGMMVYNGWGELVLGWEFGLSFVLIYLFVWLLVFLDTLIKTQKINRALKARRNQRKGKI